MVSKKMILDKHRNRPERLPPEQQLVQEAACIISNPEVIGVALSNPSLILQYQRQNISISISQLEICELIIWSTLTPYEYDLYTSASEPADLT
jgi:hypothetical protein